MSASYLSLEDRYQPKKSGGDELTTYAKSARYATGPFSHPNSDNPVGTLLGGKPKT